ncbi:hypothetical protein [Bradyrhizobium sp. RDM4]|uniref:hypothetical protein n=1 Tax=Bradyrhizobium sp. RDM4 TaxID=3378765 RepID=UPI0038FD38FB
MAAGVGAAWAFLVVRAGMLRVIVESDILVYEKISEKINCLNLLDGALRQDWPSHDA